MKDNRKAPEREFDLYDPKLPTINGGVPGNGAQQHICPAPIPRQETEPSQSEL